MQIPLFVLLIPVVAVCIDSAVIITVGYKMMKRIDKATTVLETTAREEVAKAADNVRKELIKLLPQRKFTGEDGRKAMGVLGSLLGLDTTGVEGPPPGEIRMQ